MAIGKRKCTKSSKNRSKTAAKRGTGLKNKRKQIKPELKRFRNSGGFTQIARDDARISANTTIKPRGACQQESNCIATECPAPHLFVFVENLCNAGLVVRADMPRDGNCFFHAIHDQLDRIGSAKRSLTASDLRAFCVKYLRSKPTLPDGTALLNFTGVNSWSDYLKQMSINKVWVDDVMVLAMACVLRRPIVIVTTVKDTSHTLNRPKQNPYGQTERLLDQAPCVVMHPYLCSKDTALRRPLLLGLLHFHYMSLAPCSHPGTCACSPKDKQNQQARTAPPCSSSSKTMDKKADKKLKLEKGATFNPVRTTVYQNPSKTSSFGVTKISSLERLRETDHGKKLLCNMTGQKFKKFCCSKLRQIGRKLR